MTTGNQPQVTVALRWIVAILSELRIPYQITGGLAARFYGATRPINDIDLDVPDKALRYIATRVRPYVTYGPQRYQDERWDLPTVILRYRGQEIDCGGCDTQRIRDKRTGVWVEQRIDLTQSVVGELFGQTIRLCPKEQLIQYKQMLEGEHQLRDVSEILK